MKGLFNLKAIIIKTARLEKIITWLSKSSLKQLLYFLKNSCSFSKIYLHLINFILCYGEDLMETQSNCPSKKP